MAGWWERGQDDEWHGHEWEPQPWQRGAGGDGVVAAQEPRCGPLAADKVHEVLRPVGAVVLPGLGPNQHLACVSKGCPARSPPQALGRLAHHAVGVGGGKVHVTSVYAPYGSGRDGDNRQACGRLVRAALLRAAEIVQAPCLVLGDFN